MIGHAVNKKKWSELSQLIREEFHILACSPGHNKFSEISAKCGKVTLLQRWQGAVSG